MVVVAVVLAVVGLCGATDGSAVEVVTNGSCVVKTSVLSVFTDGVLVAAFVRCVLTPTVGGT